MTVDQLDELIRKYLSTGVAMVLVLVGPAAAPAATAARPQAATTSAHTTGAPSRPPRRHDTGARADPTAASYGSDDAAQPGRGDETDGGDPTANPVGHSGKTRSEPGSDAATAGSTADPRPKPPTDPTEPQGSGTRPTDPTEPRDPTDRPRSRDARPAGANGRTAAATYGWGTPNREDDFTDDLSGWGVYDGPGHADNGTRSPDAARVADGVLTIEGDAEGTTAGMAWGRGEGQKYGRWEGRVRAPASDPTYHALLLLWPDAEDFPRGGEIDFMEMTDHTRQSTNVFLHHGADNAQEHGTVAIDATQWHNWAVEWTPKGVTTYVDGERWWHTDKADALPPGPMHLCIQLDWFPQKRDGAVKPSQMQVDWVRQYPIGAPPSDEQADEQTDNSVMRDLIEHTFEW